MSGVIEYIPTANSTTNPLKYPLSCNVNVIPSSLSLYSSSLSPAQTCRVTELLVSLSARLFVLSCHLRVTHCHANWLANVLWSWQDTKQIWSQASYWVYPLTIPLNLHSHVHSSLALSPSSVPPFCQAQLQGRYRGVCRGLGQSVVTVLSP